MKARSGVVGADVREVLLGPDEGVDGVLGGEHPRVRHLGRQREGDRAAAGAEIDGDRRRGCRGRAARRSRAARPSRSRGAARRRPGPTRSSRWRNGAVPMMCWSGSRVARRSTSSSSALEPRGVDARRRGWPRPARAPRPAPSTWPASSSASTGGIGDADARQALGGARGARRRAAGESVRAGP